ncbi:hypothetical protein [Lysinibacillus sp. Y5S-8]|uniref:hypothetical protein n=1 Tax=Lysinibacillus sp. Y5S-8 TaxID=3122488 RepID=UPI0030D0059A
MSAITSTNMANLSNLISQSVITGGITMSLILNASPLVVLSVILVITAFAGVAEG